MCLQARITPGMKLCAVVAVLADRQRLAERAEDHLLVGDHAAHPHGVDADAGRPRRRPGRRAAPRCASGRRAHSSDAAAIRSAVASAVPDGRVGLGVVVQLDDLGGVEVRRGELGEAHHQHGRDREVGRHDAVRAAGAELLGERRRGRRRSGRWCRRRRGCRASPATARCAAPPSATVKSTTTSAPASANAFGSPAIVTPSIVGPAADGSTAATSSSSGSSGDRRAHRRPHPPAGAAHPDSHHRDRPSRPSRVAQRS